MYANKQTLNELIKEAEAALERIKIEQQRILKTLSQDAANAAIVMTQIDLITKSNGCQPVTVSRKESFPA